MIEYVKLIGVMGFYITMSYSVVTYFCPYDSAHYLQQPSHPLSLRQHAPRLRTQLGVQAGGRGTSARSRRAEGGDYREHLGCLGQVVSCPTEMGPRSALSERVSRGESSRGLAPSFRETSPQASAQSLVGRRLGLNGNQPIWIGARRGEERVDAHCEIAEERSTGFAAF